MTHFTYWKRIIPAYAGSTRIESRAMSSHGDHPRIRGEHFEGSGRRLALVGSSPHTRGALAEGGCFGVDCGIIPAYAGSTLTTLRWRRSPPDHPRIRGEHSTPSPRRAGRRGSSPHTRGARGAVGVRYDQAGIIPAYAGSTPQAILLGGSCRDHPRIRGEHAVFVGGLSVGVGSSPHTRGALAAGSAEACPERIIPAYAGSTIPTPTGSCSRADHPRIRGEHRILPAGQTLPGGSSPHTRGAPDHAERSLHCPGIIPAYAGSTHIDSRFFQLKRDHPRIRGEHRAPLPTPARAHGSSPHTRGAPERRQGRCGRVRIIPAYAGSTPGSGTIAGSSQDHPRIRGEHFRPGPTPSRTSGSSPHTRGAPRGKEKAAVANRIIPAYAGSTCRSPGRSSRWSDHPRIRGEHRRVEMANQQADGSSPHTRGAPLERTPARRRRRIIPAYAGSTCFAGISPSHLSDHPRIRGEHRGLGCGSSPLAGSSPHTRGARPPRLPHRPRPRIIPAYAGSTPFPSPTSTPTGDHPRIRGEHPPGGWRCPQTTGSSPHTRGAPRPPRRSERTTGIIPAYAGSTVDDSWVTGAAAGSSPHTRGAPLTSLRRGTRSGIIPAYAGSTRTCAAGARRAHGSSPHTRGAPISIPLGSRGSGIIPAYAGSTEAVRALPAVRADHPRIRGEHSTPPDGTVLDPGSSPHTRGARAWSARPARPAGIIPAYAGSTMTATSGPVPSTDHPRIRGEHVDPITIGIGQWGSSPHTRGAQVPVPLLQRSARIIPAYAGSTWGCTWLGMVTTDHPRIRGEHVHIEAPRCPQMGSSPHTRGARRHWPARRTRSRIIPAYAGSTSAAAASCLRLWDHPRIRGEHCCWGALVFPPGGSSPHTRGARITKVVGWVAERIIPAYAGSTHAVERARIEGPDHPRIRGEHAGRRLGIPARRGSSPHTRGAPHSALVDPFFLGIIPAYAGSTRPIRRRRPVSADHPRIRGEHCPLVAGALAPVGSSPHTRGAPDLRPSHRPPMRIIPAYAGSTRRRRGRGRLGQDHPRIRGEHRPLRGPGPGCQGSSPHTRGALARQLLDGIEMRIIPAYAGSTSVRRSGPYTTLDHPRIRGEHH